MEQQEIIKAAEVIDRFLSKVLKLENGHWMWRGAVPGKKRSDRWKYGTFRFEGRLQGAHRVSWQLFNGPIPEGLLVCHSCDIPLCVNPDHLFLGTHQVNSMDSIAKGRRATQRNRLPDDTIRKIREERAKGAKLGELADRYDTEITVINGITTGRTRLGAGGPITCQKNIGRPPIKVPPRKAAKIRKLREMGATLDSLSEASGLSVWTVRRVLGLLGYPKGSRSSMGEKRGPGRPRKSKTIQKAEARAIRAALRRHQGNVSKAAKDLNIPRRTFYLRCARHEIEPGWFRPG